MLAVTTKSESEIRDDHCSQRWILMDSLLKKIGTQVQDVLEEHKKDVNDVDTETPSPL